MKPNTLTVTSSNHPDCDMDTALGVYSIAEPAVVVGMFSQLVRPDACTIPAANDAAMAELDIEDGLTDNVPKRLSADRALTMNVIGPRIVAARELNGVLQTELARMLGYQTPAHLSQVEAGRRAPNLGFIVRVSTALAVSANWLLGLDDEPDFDPKFARRVALQRSVRSQLDAVVGALAETFEKHHALTSPICTAHLVGAAGGVLKAFDTFRAANEDAFDEMPAGASLAHAVRHLDGHVQAARASIRQHDSFDASLRLALRAANVPVSRRVDTGGKTN